MSNTSIETVTSTADRIKLGLALLVIIVSLVGFSVLSAQPMVSGPGRRALSFAGESYNEVKRVSWPSRKETTQMTGIVFAFVGIMGIFMWIIDKSIEWILYGLLLGWK